MKKILRSVADELRKQGKSNSEIRKEIIDMPLITDTAKNQILREVGIYYNSSQFNNITAILRKHYHLFV